jgi:hypothetical protein
MPIDPSKDTIHLVVKSPYIVQILKNTNPIELTVNHYVDSDSVTIKNTVTDDPNYVNVISAVLSTNTHHDKFDQVVFENSYVRLIIEYQMLYE